MSSVAEQSIHEVDFCAQVAAAVRLAHAEDPTLPFAEARLEGFGTGLAKRKRKDLRFYEPGGKLALCGEVKLPGTHDGRSPYAEEFVRDAFLKADNAVVDFFFTWNVNVFVLWDRRQYDRPLLERRVREWKLGLTLARPEDVARPENLDFIRRRFLPDLLRDLAEIYSGRRRDWTMPPDDIFIRSLESHLEWPAHLTSAFLVEQTERNKILDGKVQQWLTAQDRTYVRNDFDDWRDTLRNMAKTLAYVWANRLIFYKALRARFTDLPPLELRRSVKTAEDAARTFARCFEKAVQRSGDYEPLLFPTAEDWALRTVFEPPGALDAWRGFLRGIDSVDFQDVPSDIVGRIFQKLIGPEERHRYGQHFTADDPVDVINAFCIQGGADHVLDPACGSGSFLVRAYYRKRCLDPARDHAMQLAELFGCDIALYPAHLATLNLAAREINEERNYPRIARRDFFDVQAGKPFCTLPAIDGGTFSIEMPALDAIVGNPPYVRQEKIEPKDKRRNGALVTAAWPGLKLSGRADLHCYFWPAAARFLKPGGRFGFLTSSSWLDNEYGFALQGWILAHFKLLAVLESNAEPWFSDARVKTAITILQRCDDDTERMENRVRFVRFDKPLREVIGAPVSGTPSGAEEGERQRAVERLRDRILSASTDVHDDALRIIVRSQRHLWTDGVRAGSILRDSDMADGEADHEPVAAESTTPSKISVESSSREYVAGKWGRYLRAPDVYFVMMQRFRSRFVPLGELVTLRRGITSGCDAFFMPKDVTAQRLATLTSDREFRQHTSGAARRDAQRGHLKIVEAGDGSIHPVEASHLAPELHGPMKVTRPVVSAAELDRVVLLVHESLDTLKREAPWTWRYLRYGMTATFASAKSKGLPVPQRPTCRARDPWYDLTALVRPGFALWPKSQQYRHVIPLNRDGVVANCNMYDIADGGLPADERIAMVAVLNSTIVALFKTFYGRFAGTEGNLKTEVVDVNLLEVPDPRGAPAPIVARLSEAWDRLSQRATGRLVEEQLMDCHTIERARRIAQEAVVLPEELQQADRRALDDAVLELLGVADPGEREELRAELYAATAQHFRDIRVVEIEKMEQRSVTAKGRITVHELAIDAWDAAELLDETALIEWMGRRPECTVPVIIPDARPAERSPSPMFDPNTVYFGLRAGRRAGTQGVAHLDCSSNGQAQLILSVANLGVSGRVNVPADEDACLLVLREMNFRLGEARRRFEELAESRTGDPRQQVHVVEQLMGWFVHGRKTPKEVDFD